MDRIIWGNSIENYLWVIGSVLFVLILNRIISKYLATLVFKLFRSWLKVYDKQKFTDLVVHPLSIFLVVTVTIVAFYRLDYPPQLNFKIYKYPLQQVLLAITITVQI